MPQRKIHVVFHVPGHYDDDFGTSIPLTRATPEQLRRLQESIANATLPFNACPTSLSINYTDRMSFLNGGARENKITGRHRRIEISDLFYLAEFDTKCPACGTKKCKTEISATRHCATNLRAGRCKDEFMRATLGTVLFPQFYAKDKQK